MFRAATTEANAEGITGLMYGCAAGILSACWIHGEAFRRWHNSDCASADQAKKANESGGVINPAILTVEM